MNDIRATEQKLGKFLYQWRARGPGSGSGEGSGDAPRVAERAECPVARSGRSTVGTGTSGTHDAPIGGPATTTRRPRARLPSSTTEREIGAPPLFFLDRSSSTVLIGRCDRPLRTIVRASSSKSELGAAPKSPPPPPPFSPSQPAAARVGASNTPAAQRASRKSAAAHLRGGTTSSSGKNIAS